MKQTILSACLCLCICIGIADDLPVCDTIRPFIQYYPNSDSKGLYDASIFLTADNKKYISVILVYENTDTTRVQTMYGIVRGGTPIYTMNNKAQSMLHTGISAHAVRRLQDTGGCYSRYPQILSTIYRMPQGKDSIWVCLGHGITDTADIFRGRIREVLLYNHKPNRISRMSAETYMALKYGISMYNVDYVSPEGKIIWDARANSPYTNAVSGMGADSIYGLSQKEGVSIADSFMHISVNMPDSAVITPGTYLLWGHNGAGITAGNTITEHIPFGGSTADTLVLMSRIWLMQHTCFDMSGVSVKVRKDALEQDTLYMLLSGSSTFTGTDVQCYKSVGHDSEYVYFSVAEWNMNDSGRLYMSFAYSLPFLLQSKAARQYMAAEYGTAEHVSGTGISVFPVPAKDKLTVEVAADGAKSINVYDAEGRLCYTKQGICDTRFNIDVSLLSAGTYIMHISTVNGTYIKKFIKEN